MDFTVVIPRFFFQDGVTYYDVQITGVRREMQWTLPKRYSHFYDINIALSKKYPGLPPLPPKTFLPTNDEAYLKYRREELQRFVGELARREDLRTSEEVWDFLQVARLGGTVPRPEMVLEEHIAKPIREGYLSRDLFVFTQYEPLSMYRIDAYLSSIHIPFLTRRKEYLGYTEIHTRSLSALSMKWRAYHELLPTALAYSPRLGLVFLGFSTGALQGFLINSESPALQFTPHSQSIRGLAFSSDSSQLISISDDKRISVLDLTANTVLFVVALPDPPLTLLWWGEELVVLFAGNMGLFTYGDSGPMLDVWLSPETDMKLTCVAICRSVAFMGTETGQIVVYQIDKRKECGLLVWAGRITAIVHSESRKELMTSNHTGQIAVFNTLSGQLLRVFTADFGEISYLALADDEHLLFVSGEERKLRVYRMPEVWAVAYPSGTVPRADEPVHQPSKPIENSLEGWDR